MLRKLNLYGGMPHTLLFERRLHIVQYSAIAHLLFDDHVAGSQDLISIEAPHVHIVNRFNAFN